MRGWLREAAGGLPRQFWFLWAGTLINRLGAFVVLYLAIYLTQDLHFTPSKAGLVLGAYGVGRLQFEPRPTVTDVVRKGLGKWQTSLVDLGAGLLGVGHRRARSMSLVSTLDGRLVKRVRAAGAGVLRPKVRQALRREDRGEAGVLQLLAPVA